MTTSHTRAIAHLRKTDPILARIIARVPLAPHSRGSNHFQSLVVAIVNQQLSGRAADTIVRRFRALFPTRTFPTPDQVLKMQNRTLRRAGLSGKKTLYIKELAQAVSSGELDFRKIRKMKDEDVIVALTAVKGIGRWTAEMFLMFSLNRDDIFSFGDLGLRNALIKHYGKAPESKIKKIVASWSPYRTHASHLLWASLD